MHKFSSHAFPATSPTPSQPERMTGPATRQVSALSAALARRRLAQQVGSCHFTCCSCAWPGHTVETPSPWHFPCSSIFGLHHSCKVKKRKSGFNQCKLKQIHKLRQSLRYEYASKHLCRCSMLLQQLRFAWPEQLAHNAEQNGCYQKKKNSSS